MLVYLCFTSANFMAVCICSSEVILCMYVSRDSRVQAFFFRCHANTTKLVLSFDSNCGVHLVIFHCRKFSGVCLGMQTAMVEFARNVIGWKGWLVNICYGDNPLELDALNLAAITNNGNALAVPQMLTQPSSPPPLHIRS